MATKTKRLKVGKLKSERRTWKHNPGDLIIVDIDGKFVLAVIVISVPHTRIAFGDVEIEIPPLHGSVIFRSDLKREAINFIGQSRNSLDEWRDELRPLLVKQPIAPSPLMSLAKEGM